LGAVDLWHIDLRDPRWDERRQWLSDVERNRAGSFVRIEDALRYQRCHIGLRIILSTYSGSEPSALAIMGGKWGKPELMNGPRFSLTYRMDYAVVAISDKEVGVDIERACLTPLQQEDVVNISMSERDKELFWQPLHAPLRERSFYRYWTAKEAVLKAMGVGFRMAPTKLHIAQALLSEGAVPVRSNECMCGKPYWLRHHSAPQGYYISLASEKPVSGIACYWSALDF
jgi:4'-phosphopantetheinyl transferase